MLRLTSSAVTELGVQRRFSGQLVLHFSAVTTGFVSGLEFLILIVNTVRGSCLPVLDGLGLLALCCVLVHFFTLCLCADRSGDRKLFN